MNLQTYLEKRANQQSSTVTPPTPRKVGYPQIPISEEHLKAGRPNMKDVPPAPEPTPISNNKINGWLGVPGYLKGPNMKDVPAFPEPPPISDDTLNGWLGIPGYLRQRKTKSNTLKERKVRQGTNLPTAELHKEVTSPESYYMPTPPTPEPPPISEDSLLRGAELMDRLNKRKPENLLKPIRQ